MNRMLDPNIVLEYVQEIIRASRVSDDEAHALEDELHERVLEAIANNDCVNPQSCAKVALTTRGINFSRWYA